MGADDGEIFAGVLGDDLGGSGSDELGIDEIGSDAEGEGSGFEELLGGGEGDAAGGDHLDVGERGFESFEVLSAAHGGGGEDFDDVGAGFPGGDDLGGGERAGKDGDGVAVAELYGAEVERGRDDVLRAFEDAHASGLGVEDSAGANEDVGALFGEGAHDADGSRDGHGDFESRDAAGGDRIRERESLLFGLGAEDGDEAEGAKCFEDC